LHGRSLFEKPVGGFPAIPLAAPGKEVQKNNFKFCMQNAERFVKKKMQGVSAGDEKKEKRVTF